MGINPPNNSIIALPYRKAARFSHFLPKYAEIIMKQKYHAIAAAFIGARIAIFITLSLWHELFEEAAASMSRRSAARAHMLKGLNSKKIGKASIGDVWRNQAHGGGAGMPFKSAKSWASSKRAFRAALNATPRCVHVTIIETRHHMPCHQSIRVLCAARAYVKHHQSSSFILS